MKDYAIPISLVGAALIIVGGLAYLISPDTGSTGLVNAAVGLLLVVSAGFINADLFKQYGRWLNAFWGGIMVFGIVAMINFLSNRYAERLDLTEGQLHSLSDLTIETLQNLDHDVEALAFMEGGENADLELLLAEFSNRGSRFTFEMIDPDRDPMRTEENGIKRYNTLLIKSGDKQQQITELEEREITNALLKVIRERQDKVYLSVGHGERDPSSGPGGLGMLKERLQEIDYAIDDSLFLARTARVPSDCAVLVIAGPRTPFLPTEVATLRAYLQEGGSVLALLDPLSESGLEDLLLEWGVSLGDDFVIDTSGIGSLFGLDFTTPVSVSYGKHPITRKHQGVMTFYQLSRSVVFDAESTGVGFEGEALALTSEAGWAEKDLRVLQGEGDSTVKLDEGVDTPGPISLAVAVEGKGGRLVVFGDSDFATNQYFDYQGNGDLALNALSWLAEDESLISIRPRQAGYNPIALNDSQGEWIFWISVVLYPLAIALVGLLVVSRKGRWSVTELVGAGLGIVLSLGIAALLNFLGDRYNIRHDMTADALFTLSDDSKRLMSTVEEEGQYVHVKTFMSEMEGMRFQDLMKEYNHQSDYFDYELVDPQKNALQVEQNNIRERGTSIVEVRGDGQVRSERIMQMSEEALSNAILKALRARDMKAYFTTGHGEAELDQVDGKGYSLLKGRLRELNFEVVSGLQLQDGVPDDASLLVVLAPKERFSAVDAEVLQRYLDGGGRALFLLDPGAPTGLEALLDAYSIELGQDFVVDLSGLGQLFGADVSVPVVINYGDHPISERLSSGTMSFFPLARSVRPAGHRLKSPQIAALALTHQSSWGERDLSPVTGEGGQVEFDPDVDLRGPVSLAVAVQADPDTSLSTEGQVRVVVFGDADFASNEYFSQQANGALVANSIEWLTEDEDRLQIADRRPAHNPINLIGNQGSVVLWVSVFVLPFAVALSGLVMVLKRGYQNHEDGFIAWLIYSFAANAVFMMISAVVALSEAKGLEGQVNLVVGLLSGAVAYGLHRRATWVWLPSIAMALLSALGGFWVIPNETIQLLYAAAFITNVAILVWIRRVFEVGRETA
ncbi:MAG: hypothetical protein CME28_09325 [Gemmatimonadetes bacterium]|nr:hypothetical protein [Gemmatimonadota bacterium]|tara:strand:+ start:9641 stop:12865 length:3225 start_codon:yes stop_codon:yes gene_type:complete